MCLGQQTEKIGLGFTIAAMQTSPGGATAIRIRHGVNFRSARILNLSISPAHVTIRARWSRTGFPNFQLPEEVCRP